VAQRPPHFGAAAEQDAFEGLAGDGVSFDKDAVADDGSTSLRSVKDVVE